MEQYFTVIDRLAKQSLPAIAAHAPETGLFAGSIELNTSLEKYHLFATPGEATPIAFERKETMEAFVRQLYTVAATGQDREYSPTMRASEALKGCKVLIYSNADLALPDEATRLQLPDGRGDYETANLIGQQAREHEAQIVIIDDATRLLGSEPHDVLGSWPREAVVMLNCIAEVQDITLLYGFNVNEATDNALTYIARHAHNLCQLTEGSIELAKDEAEPQTVDYFCFTYGRPTPHRIVYSIGESGTVTIPPHVTDLLRVQDCKVLLREDAILQPKLIDRMFGYYQGQFAPSTFPVLISKAEKYGLITKSGESNKTTVKFVEAAPSRNPYKGNIALTALGDPHDKKENKYHTPRKAVAKFGEFKLLHMDYGVKTNMGNNFMAYLIKAIATKGKAFGGCIDVPTPHRNTLVIVIGTQHIADKLQAFVGKPKEADLEIVSTNGDMTDSDLLHLYRAMADQKPRDFVLIVGLDRATPTVYTPLQMARQLAMTAKQRGFLAIAQTADWSNSDLLEFTGDEVWRISQLFCEEERESFPERYADLPNYYHFQAHVGDRPFFGKFTRSGDKPQRIDYKKSLFVSKFYWCNFTQPDEIDATIGEIRAARKAKFIKVQKDNSISFVE